MKLFKFVPTLFFVVPLLLGVTSAAAGDELPRHGLLGVAASIKNGAVTASQIIPNSAAAQGGLQPGDVILAVDGVRVTTIADFLTKVHRPAGRPIALTIQRGSQTSVKSLITRSPPDEVAPGIVTTYGTVKIDGTLRRTLITRPVNAHGPLPGVFLIGGIGCFSVDASNPQDGYRNVAIDISRAGFVVHRLEKSGVGDSEGPPCSTVDFQTEYASYEVALKAFMQTPMVQQKHVYVLGHSIGTVIAPRLALGAPLAGIIVADGVGVNWIEYELLNLQRQAILSGRTPAQVDDDVANKEYCMHRLLIDKESPQKILADRPTCADAIAYPAPPAYIQQVAALNIAQPWMNVSIPVLAIYGGADYVTAQSDQERIVSIVNAHYPGRASFILIPNMNHYLSIAASPEVFMQQSVKGTPMVYNRRFSSAVINWLCRKEHCKAG